MNSHPVFEWLRDDVRQVLLNFFLEVLLGFRSSFFVVSETRFAEE